MFYIDVIEYTTGKVVKTYGPYWFLPDADKADDGINRQLDRDKYYTAIYVPDNVFESSEE